MVLLFWALSLFSSANASSFGYGGSNLPTVVEGPVINMLRNHYCKGGGQTLYLSRDIIRTSAFLADQKMTEDLYYENGSVWIGSLYSKWDDTTVFADIPRSFFPMLEKDIYHGVMHDEFASLLRVRCAQGEQLVPYTIEEIPETTITVGQ
jgi:hypothetical protein